MNESREEQRRNGGEERETHAKQTAACEREVEKSEEGQNSGGGGRKGWGSEEGRTDQGREGGGKEGREGRGKEGRDPALMEHKQQRLQGLAAVPSGHTVLWGQSRATCPGARTVKHLRSDRCFIRRNISENHSCLHFLCANPKSALHELSH